MIVQEFHRGPPGNLAFLSLVQREENLSRASAKEIYRKLSMYEPSIPIFSRGWWLDAATGAEDWEVALVRKGDRIVAAMPYVLQRRFGLSVLCQPALTQKLGPWFASGDGKPATRLSKEKELMQTLIDQLPAFDHFSQNWHYGCTNWLPFYWNGFRQTTRYTYLLTELGDIDKQWRNLQHNTRSECRKATERFRLLVRDDLPLDDFLELNRMTFLRQGMAVPYSDDYVRRLDAACTVHGCRKYLIAVGPDGRHHAGCYIVWDEHNVYGLMVGSNPDLRTSGAVSLCFWEAIKFAARTGRSFDFSGSMREPVERFFRGFGAKQLPYFNISKTPSRLLRIQQCVQSVLKGI